MRDPQPPSHRDLAFFFFFFAFFAADFAFDLGWGWNALYYDDTGIS